MHVIINKLRIISILSISIGSWICRRFYRLKFSELQSTQKTLTKEKIIINSKIYCLIIVLKYVNQCVSENKTQGCKVQGLLISIYISIFLNETRKMGKHEIQLSSELLREKIVKWQDFKFKFFLTYYQNKPHVLLLTWVVILSFLGILKKKF